MGLSRFILMSFPLMPDRVGLKCESLACEVRQVGRLSSEREI
jgi:hypothetical protein